MKRVLLYARCSTTKDQKPEIQIEEMRRYCEARGWFVNSEVIDHGQSGKTDKRPGLNQVMQLVRARKVDVVIVLKLDRLFRSLKHLISTLEEFNELGVEFISIRDQMDLTTSSGRFMMHVIGAFGELERELIRERTLLGLEHARNSGKILGRPIKHDEQKILSLRASGKSYRQIMKELNCPMGVVSRVIAAAPKTPQNPQVLGAVKTRG